MSADGGDYGVGYRKPPVNTRFKPGQSGNLKGRPKYDASLESELIAALKKKVFVVENGERKAITKLQSLCTQLVNKSAAGDLMAIRMISNILKAIEPHVEHETVTVSETSDKKPHVGKSEIDWSIFTPEEMKQMDKLMLKIEDALHRGAKVISGEEPND